MLHCLLAEFQAVNERIQLDPALIWCKMRPGEAGTGTRRLQAPQPRGEMFFYWAKVYGCDTKPKLEVFHFKVVL